MEGSPEPVGPFLIQFWALCGVCSGTRTGNTRGQRCPPGPRVAVGAQEAGVRGDGGPAGRGRWGLGPLGGAVAKPRNARSALPPLGAQALTLGFTQSLSAGPSSEGPAPAGCPAPTPSRGSRCSLLAPVVTPGAAPCALGCPREDARAPGLSLSQDTRPRTHHGPVQPPSAAATGQQAWLPRSLERPARNGGARAPAWAVLGWADAPAVQRALPSQKRPV